MVVQDTKAEDIAGADEIKAEKINAENALILHRGRYNEPGAAGQDVYAAVKKAREHMRKTGVQQGTSGKTR